MLGRKGAPGDDVVAEFRAAIRLRPDYAEAHNNLGLVLIQSGKDEEGIAALREAVRLAPAYAEARTNLGAALTPTDTEAAIKELEEAVRLAPGSVKALFNLAVAYGASPAHGPRKGIEQLEKVIEMAPDFPRAHLALGKALLQDGKVTEAVAALQNAVKLEPEGGEANYQLGLALVRAGRKEEGAAQLKRGRELVAAGDRAQNALLDVADGRAALDRGDLEEAVSKFRRAVGAPAGIAGAAAPARRCARAPRETKAAASGGRHADGAGERLGRVRGGRPGASVGARRLHPRRQVGRSRAAPHEIRRRASEVVLGLVRARLQPTSRRRRSASRSKRSPSRSSSI